MEWIRVSEHRTKGKAECQSQVDGSTVASSHRERPVTKSNTSKRQKITRIPKHEEVSKWILKRPDLKGVSPNLGISCRALYRSPLKSA